MLDFRSENWGQSRVVAHPSIEAADQPLDHRLVHAGFRPDVLFRMTSH